MSQNPYGQYEDPYYRRPDGDSGYIPPAPPRMSGLGLTSLIIGCVVILIEIGGVVASAMLVDAATGEPDPEDPALAAAGLVICGGLLLSLLGAGLGLGALFQSGRSKTLAIIGLVINGLVVLGVGCLMAIGLAMQGAAM